MLKSIKSLLIIGAMTAGISFATANDAAAAGSAVELPQQSWPHHGATGTYDKAALQRGFQVYREVCASCHSLKYLSYRNLEGIGFNPDEIKAIAAEYTVEDGPNDEGEMFDRPALPSDRFVGPYANDKEAAYANNGAFPPDMSLLVKARPDGENYIFALLTGYKNSPEEAGVHADPETGKMPALPEGMHWNKYFAGQKISMAPPLSDGIVTYSSGLEPTVEQMSRDVVQFLAWAAEPHADQHKRTGWKVIFYLMILASVLYAVKRRIWADVK